MELALSNEQLESLNKDGNWYKDFKIVAVINQVSKPSIRLSSRAISGYESEIDVGYFNLILIKGKCLDFLK